MLLDLLLDLVSRKFHLNQKILDMTNQICDKELINLLLYIQMDIYPE